MMCLCLQDLLKRRMHLLMTEQTCRSMLFLQNFNAPCLFADVYKADSPKNCVEFGTESWAISFRDPYGCVPKEQVKCFSSEADASYQNKGFLVTGSMADAFLSYGDPKQLELMKPLTSPKTDAQSEGLCCRMEEGFSAPKVICGKASNLKDHGKVVISVDGQAGLPKNLNINGCFHFLNSLNDAQHTALTVRELMGFYKQHSDSDSAMGFIRYAGLVLWSVLRASDQFEKLYSADEKWLNDGMNRQKYDFLRPPRGFDQFDYDYLASTLEVSTKMSGSRVLLLLLGLTAYRFDC